MIEQAKILLLTKNQGNQLQDFIYQTGQISAGGAKAPGAPIDKGTAQQHGNQALEGLRTLGTLIISNGQFRKLREYFLPDWGMSVPRLIAASERRYHTSP